MYLHTYIFMYLHFYVFTYLCNFIFMYLPHMAMWRVLRARCVLALHTAECADLTAVHCYTVTVPASCCSWPSALCLPSPIRPPCSHCGRGEGKHNTLGQEQQDALAGKTSHILYQAKPLVYFSRQNLSYNLSGKTSRINCDQTGTAGCRHCCGGNID